MITLDMRIAGSLKVTTTGRRSWMGTRNAIIARKDLSASHAANERLNLAFL